MSAKVLNTNNQELDVTEGIWSYTVKVTSGSAELSFDENESGFVVLEGTSFSATGGGILTLPRSIVKATIAGDAIITLSKVSNLR